LAVEVTTEEATGQLPRMFVCGDEKAGNVRDGATQVSKTGNLRKKKTGTLSFYGRRGVKVTT